MSAYFAWGMEPLEERGERSSVVTWRRGSALVLGAIVVVVASCSTEDERPDAAMPEPGAISGASNGVTTAGPIYSVSLEFDGNEKLSRPDLEAALNALVVDLARHGVDDTATEDGVYELESYYVTQGFPSARISASWKRDGNRFALRFQIVEGQREYVAAPDIEIRGRSKLPLSELGSCFVWVQEGTFGSLTQYVLGFGNEVLGLQKAVYTEDALLSALDCVRTVYQLEGFFFASTTHTVERLEPGRVAVRVEITEGPRVTLRTPLEITGVRAFPVAEIEAALGLGESSLFVPRLPLVLKGRVLDFYRRRGYLYVQVDTSREIDRDAAEARVSIEVDEGPLVRIGKVRVDGGTHTWRSVVDRYLRLVAGDLYDVGKLRESTRGLLRSGLFESATIEPVSPSDDDGGPGERVRDTEGEREVDLLVRVVEKPRYRVGFLAGWGSWERVRGSVVFENTNVFGSGHRASIEGAASFRHLRTETDYSVPYVFHEDVLFDVSAFYELRENPSYTIEETGTDPGFTIRWTERFRTRLFHSLRLSELVDVRGSVPRQLQADAFVSSANVALLYDDRVNFLNPTSGTIHRVRIEYAADALGSDLDFLRPTLTASWVVPVYDRLRFVLGAETGAIVKLDDTEDIPLQERFFSGGETSIRSFQQDEAGPKRGSDPIGGEAIVTLHAELRHPIEPLPFLAGLDGAIFVDAGSISESHEDYGGGRWLFAVGCGLRYNTPVGPLRADFGFNPDREPGEDFFVFHFGLGYPF